MLKYIEEFKKYVAITGFKNIIIKNLEEFLAAINSRKTSDMDIQAFNAELVATWRHLYFAVLNALIAFENKESISRKVSVEIMLYASAQRQIRRATEILGVKPHSTSIAIVVIGEKPETVKLTLSRISKQINAKLDDAILELTDEKAVKIQKVFGIAREELESVAKNHQARNALVNLVIEHVALLSTKR